MKELERTFCVAQSTVAGIISRLEQKGFIEAFGDASDKRIKVVHITPAGEVCCREAAGYMAEAEQMLLHAAYDYGVSFAHILLCTSFLFGVFYVLTNALQARGAATESLIVNISRQGLIYVHPWGDLSRNRTDLGTACGGCLVSAVGYWAVFPHVG